MRSRLVPAPSFAIWPLAPGDRPRAQPLPPGADRAAPRGTGLVASRRTSGCPTGRQEGGAQEGQGGAALVTDAIEIGAQRMVGEVVFPEAGSQELDLQRGMRIDALEHIHQIDVGSDAVQATGG